MLKARNLALLSMLAFAAPAATANLEARQIWGQAQPRQTTTPAFNTGYGYGVTAGEQDGRSGRSYGFTNEANYRRADLGYRTQYGSLDRYRDDFRRGFQNGYQVGYDRYARQPGNYGNGNYGNYGNYGGYGSYGGYGGYGASGGRYDLAASQGYTDGYNEGLKDGRQRHRNDPIAESRYRQGDHGYENSYGPRETYKLSYRNAFRTGYEQGFREARPW